MITNVKVVGHEVHIRHELEPNEIKVMKELKEKGYLEYRSSYKEGEVFFEGSNTGLSISSLAELERQGFIEQDLDAWHTQYNLTKFGEKIVEELA